MKNIVVVHAKRTRTHHVDKHHLVKRKLSKHLGETGEACGVARKVVPVTVPYAYKVPILLLVNGNVNLHESSKTHTHTSHARQNAHAHTHTHTHTHTHPRTHTHTCAPHAHDEPLFAVFFQQVW